MIRAAAVVTRCSVADIHIHTYVRYDTHGLLVVLDLVRGGLHNIAVPAMRYDMHARAPTCRPYSYI